MKNYNLNRPEIVHDDDDPDGFQTGYDRIGPKIGASQIGATIYEMPPGQALCPYHYEYPEEEWVIVLEGNATLRHPGGEDQLEPGDVVCFPTGPEGAHQLKNTGSEGNVRVLMLSTKQPVGIAVYPDSDKILASPGNSEDRIMVRRESGVDYWDRET
ncbi:MAG TPA: cupin domain-containing protein [Thermoleophilaceae bacterium]|nr:cupin domain-containing protein [Thermoleophilaceae bacterium]